MKAPLLTFALATSLSQAVTLARWTPVSTALPKGVEYDSSADTPTADEVAANITASVADRVGAAQGTSNAGASWTGVATDGAASISLGDYTTFTLTPVTGFAIDYNFVSYDYASFTQATNGGYETFIRSSVDNFAADLDQVITTASAGNLLFDVSSLTGITGPVEFRIYAIAPTAANTSRWFDLVGDDTATDLGLIVDGTVSPVAIPEPSSSLLAGFAGLGLLALRRRK